MISNRANDDVLMVGLVSNICFETIIDDWNVLFVKFRDLEFGHNKIMKIFC